MIIEPSVRRFEIRVWRSLVSRLNGVQEAAGSSPVTRTKKHLLVEAGAFSSSDRSGTSGLLRRRSRREIRRCRDSGPAGAAVPLVQVQSLGPNNDNPNYIIQVGNVFGFIISIDNVL